MLNNTKIKDIFRLKRKLWIKKIGPHRIKNRTDFPASNSYYYYLTARNTDTHKSTKNTDTKYGTLKKEIQTYILKKQGRPSCPKLLPLEIQTHE